MSCEWPFGCLYPVSHSVTQPHDTGSELCDDGIPAKLSFYCLSPCTDDEKERKKPQ